VRVRGRARNEPSRIFASAKQVGEATNTVCAVEDRSRYNISQAAEGDKIDVRIPY